MRVSIRQQISLYLNIKFKICMVIMGFNTVYILPCIIVWALRVSNSMSFPHSRWSQWIFYSIHCNSQRNFLNHNYILTVVLAPRFHSWLAQFAWSHLVSSVSHSSGRNQMESVIPPSPLVSHAPEGCSALSYHPHCNQGEKSLLEVVL